MAGSVLGSVTISPLSGQQMVVANVTPVVTNQVPGHPFSGQAQAAACERQPARPTTPAAAVQPTGSPTHSDATTSEITTSSDRFGVSDPRPW